MKIEIRNPQAADIAYLYDICLKTASNGQDAADLYTDPWLVGQYYVAPYVFFDPSNCFIAYDSESEYKRPLGYIVGTDDTRAFYDWFYSEWAPQLRKIYGKKMPPQSKYEAWLINEIYNKNKQVDDVLLDSYAGHLHIDLLPVLQGQGVGRSLIDRFSNALRKKMSNGIHLGVSKKNTGAIAFYKKMDFVELQNLEEIFILGKKL